MRSLAAATAGVGVVLAVWWAQQWVTGRSGRLLALGTDALLPPVLATFLAVALLAFALATAGAPTLLDLARRADRVFGLRQRLSTSFEVAAAGATTSLLAQALLSDVERRLPELDAGVVGRPATSTWARVAVATGVALGLLALTLPVPARGPAATVVAAPAQTAPAPTPQDVEALGRFASVLAEVAAREDSDYLRAVAASFEELAERVADGSVAADEAGRTLGELLGHLETAAAQVSDAFADAVRAVAADESAAVAPSAETTSVEARPVGAGEADGGAPGAGEPARVDATAVAADASLYMALADLANELGDDPGGLGLRLPRPAFVDVDADDAFYGGVGRAVTDPNAVPPEPSGLRADAPGAGDAVGAAEQSSERAGDAAGGGRAELGGGADGFLGLDAEAVDEVLLPRNEREDGRFVEVELVPDEASETGARAATDAADGAPFRRADEAVTTTRAIGAAYRDVVGRYFMPGAVQADGAP